MKKEIITISFALLVTFSCAIILSFAYLKPSRNNDQGLSTTAVVSKSINLEVTYPNTVNNTLGDLLPLSDEDGILQNGFSFSVTNNTNDWQFYSIKLVDQGVSQNQTKMNSLDLRVNISPQNNPDLIRTFTLAELQDGILIKKKINSQETQSFVIRAWLNKNADEYAKNKYFNTQIVVEGITTPKTYQLLDDINMDRDNSEMLGCNADYSVCDTYSEVEDAVLDQDINISHIILYDDELFDDDVDVPAGKTMDIDLNGFSFLRERSGPMINNFGDLTINDSMASGTMHNTYDGCSRIIENYNNLVINNGRYIVDGSCCVVRNGKTSSLTGITTINNGSFIVSSEEGSEGAIKSYSEEIHAVIINNGYFDTAATPVVYISSDVTNQSEIEIDINGGIFVGRNYPIIYTSRPNIVNITNTNTPIYITSLQKNSLAAIYHDEDGTINITGARANACTRDPKNTTSGICVYAEGTRDFTSTKSNGAINNKNDGTININGGTYYGGYQGINNYRNGTINIKNATIISGNYGIVNGHSKSYDSIVNICSSTVNGGNIDIYNETKNALNYYNITFTNGTQTPTTNSIYNDKGTVNPLESCPI